MHFDAVQKVDRRFRGLSGVGGRRGARAQGLC